MWEVQGSLWLYSVVGCVTDWQQETRSLSYLGIASPLRKVFLRPESTLDKPGPIQFGALPEVKFERNRSLLFVKRPFENLRIIHIRSEQALLQKSFDQGLVVS
jgi:hypothetical protein